MMKLQVQANFLYASKKNYNYKHIVGNTLQIIITSTL